ncbi:MAG: CPBP family intramembrane metalloprotease, partial [Pseudomonadota bacterium]|nr:CPBP family intramembrane metalloprotease [Pseudomonadota bacterium]
MTGIELYAERKRTHRRTWTIAAIVLGVVFMIGGQLGAYLPAIAAGFLTPGGGADGWPQLAYERGAAFGLGSVLVLL